MTHLPDVAYCPVDGCDYGYDSHVPAAPETAQRRQLVSAIALIRHATTEHDLDATDLVAMSRR